MPSAASGSAALLDARVGQPDVLPQRDATPPTVPIAATTVSFAATGQSAGEPAIAHAAPSPAVVHTPASPAASSHAPAAAPPAIAPVQPTGFGMPANGPAGQGPVQPAATVQTGPHQNAGPAHGPAAPRPAGLHAETAGPHVAGMGAGNTAAAGPAAPDASGPGAAGPGLVDPSAAGVAAAGSPGLAALAASPSGAGAPAGQAEPGTALPAASPPAAQLGQAVASLHVGQDGTSQLTLRLDPAGLGHVSVRITRGPDGSATVIFAVERAETLGRLQADITHLHLALDRAGVPEQRSVAFNLAPPGQDSAGQGSLGQNSAGQGSAGQNSPGYNSPGQHSPGQRSPTGVGLGAAPLAAAGAATLPARDGARLRAAGINITA